LPPRVAWRRRPLSPPAAAVAPAGRLAAPAPRWGGSLAPAGGGWAGRGPRGRTAWPRPGRPGRRWASSPGPRGGGARLLPRALPRVPLALEVRLVPPPPAPPWTLAPRPRRRAGGPRGDAPPRPGRGLPLPVPPCGLRQGACAVGTPQTSGGPGASPL